MLLPSQSHAIKALSRAPKHIIGDTLCMQWLLDQANKPGNEDTQLKHLTPSICQAIHWSLQAWKQCVTAQTIQNCWRKSGLLPGLVLNPAANADVAPDDVDASESAAEMMSDELADADAQPEVDPTLVELANAIENLQT
jgi:hypothetical protein